MKKIAITGAGGNVGTALRTQLLQHGYQLVCIDLKPGAAASGETWIQGDITDGPQMVQAFEGVDAVIHLAAATADLGWPVQMQLSIQGRISVFEAARSVGVRRIIYASTHHVVGLHPRPPLGQAMGTCEVLRPDSRYGVAKAFGESLGAMFAYKHDMEVMAIRIGLEHPGLRFEIVYGISDRTGLHYDNAAAYALGYDPQDGVLAPAMLEEVLAGDPAPFAGSAKAVSAAEISLGGGFSQSEFDGSALRLVG